MKTTVVLLTAIALSLTALFLIVDAHGDLEWVHGRYGEKCYIKGTEHENIKYPLYFDSREACLRDLAL